MKNLFTVMLCLMLFAASGISQNEVDILPDGIVVPRTTPGAVGSPVEGQLIYNTSTDSYYYFDGTNWLAIAGSAAASDMIIDADSDTKVELIENPTGDEVHTSIDGSVRMKLIRESGGNTRLEIINDSENTIIGADAGLNNTGAYNSLYGNSAGYSNSGSFNSFFGSSAGFYTSGDSNSFFGNAAGFSNTTAAKNSFFGNFSGISNTTGAYNCFFGSSSGFVNSTGNYNTFIGFESGYFNATGDNNAFVGNGSGKSNTIGLSNSYFGADAGGTNTEGNYNCFIGSGSGYLNVTGSNNVFLGFQAGFNETGSNKLYIENSNNTATSALIYGDFNTDYLNFNADVDVDGTLLVQQGGAANTLTVDGGTDGITLKNIGDDAIQVENATGDGVYVQDAAHYGLHVQLAGIDGLLVESALDDGIEITGAGNNAIEITNAGADAIYISNAIDDAIQIDNAGSNGIEIGTTVSNGVYIGNPGTDGLRIANAGDDAIEILSAADDGIIMNSVTGDGIQINGAGNYGIKATGTAADAYFTGASNKDAIVLDGGLTKIRHHFNFLVTDRNALNFLMDADNSGGGATFSIFNDVNTNSGTPSLKFSLDSGTSWFDAPGSFGIGLTNPMQKLHVDGAIRLEGIGSGQMIYTGASEALWYNGSYYSWGFGGNYNYFADEIKIGGGGTSGPSHILHINGIGRSTQSTWATSSDQRVKDNIEDISEAGVLLNQFRPVRFDWKKSYRPDSSQREYGFIAQEVERIIPEMVTTVEENVGEEVVSDFRVLNTSALTPLLVKGYQELAKENEVLKAEINELKAIMHEVLIKISEEE